MRRRIINAANLVAKGALNVGENMKPEVLAGQDFVKKVAEQAGQTVNRLGEKLQGNGHEVFTAETSGVKDGPSKAPKKDGKSTAEKLTAIAARAADQVGGR